MEIVVASGEVSSGRLTLTPNEVTTVTFVDNIGTVQVMGHGEASVYYTVDGTQPTLDGRNTFELPANVTVVDERATRGTEQGDVVKLLSDGVATVRVQSL